MAQCVLLACAAATPPADWARGGAPLDIVRARYIKSDLLVDVLPGGQVMINGEHELTVDRAGRVVDDEGAAVALLEPDGRVVGPENAPLGQVGAQHAARPDESFAYLSVTPTGEVIRYDEEGERSNYGVWIGCNVSPRANQLCALVTHLLAERGKIPERAYQSGGPSIGVGIGIGVGR